MDQCLRRIGIILFDGADLLDVAGPASAFHMAARLFVDRNGATAERAYHVDLLSLDGGPVRTWQEFHIVTQPVGEPAPGEYDTMIVAGGIVTHATCDPRLVAWFQRNHCRLRRLGSVCTGAFILARAGLLNGRRAATHWNDCDALQARYPAIDVDPDAIFVEDRGIWTSAGVTTGIDMALAMIEEDHGHELALLVARRLVVFVKRPGGQSQFSTQLQSQSVEGPLAALLHWIVEHPDADLRAEKLAERANMSLRSFYRAFEDATGNSPAEWVESARIEVAKRLLEQTSQRIDQVARKAGFLTYERLRKTFARRIGVAPAAYRARFARLSPAPDSELDIGLMIGMPNTDDVRGMSGERG